MSVQNRRYSKNLNAISNTLRTGKANILILGDSIHNISSASTSGHYGLATGMLRKWKPNFWAGTTIPNTTGTLEGHGFKKNAVGSSLSALGGGSGASFPNANWTTFNGKLQSARRPDNRTVPDLYVPSQVDPNGIYAGSRGTESVVRFVNPSNGSNINVNSGTTFNILVFVSSGSSFWGNASLNPEEIYVGSSQNTSSRFFQSGPTKLKIQQYIGDPLEHITKITYEIRQQGNGSISSQVELEYTGNGNEIHTWEIPIPQNTEGDLTSGGNFLIRIRATDTAGNSNPAGSQCIWLNNMWINESLTGMTIHYLGDGGWQTGHHLSEGGIVPSKYWNFGSPNAADNLFEDDAEDGAIGMIEQKTDGATYRPSLHSFGTEALIKLQDTNIIMIHTGQNDGADGLERGTVLWYSQLIKKYRDLAKSMGRDPFHFILVGGYQTQTDGNASIHQQRSNYFRSFADQSDVSYIDLHQLVRDNFGEPSVYEDGGSGTTYLSDAVHPNYAGSLKFAELMWAEIVAADADTGEGGLADITIPDIEYNSYSNKEASSQVEISTDLSNAVSQVSSGYASGALKLVIDELTLTQDFENDVTFGRNLDVLGTSLNTKTIVENGGTVDNIAYSTDSTAAATLQSISFSPVSFKLVFKGIPEGCTVKVAYHFENNSDITEVKTTTLTTTKVKGSDGVGFKKANLKLNKSTAPDYVDLKRFQKILLNKKG